ncbi:unnamed protein product [Arabis nemorensis]|uniref:Uncharacterized protein n=1 Tax=Arabis nemorensis TaxID=586526 RepID=A0A565CLM6_9BRAS|nr:unnamed protein product [Arabis nemorensis]
MWIILAPAIAGWLIGSDLLFQDEIESLKKLSRAQMDEIKSLKKASRAQMATYTKLEMKLDDLNQVQSYGAQMDEMKETRKTWDGVLHQLVVPNKKKLSEVSYEEMDQKKRFALDQRMKAEYGLFKN